MKKVTHSHSWLKSWPQSSLTSLPALIITNSSRSSTHLCLATKIDCKCSGECFELILHDDHSQLTWILIIEPKLIKATTQKDLIRWFIKRSTSRYQEILTRKHHHAGTPHDRAAGVWSRGWLKVFVCLFAFFWPHTHPLHLLRSVENVHPDEQPCNSKASKPRNTQGLWRWLGQFGVSWGKSFWRYRSMRFEIGIRVPWSYRIVISMQRKTNDPSTPSTLLGPSESVEGGELCMCFHTLDWY